MKRYWELARKLVDGRSLRERGIIFLTMAFLTFALLNVVLLDPMLAQQQSVLAQLKQKQEKMKELQAQKQTQVQSMEDDKNSPLRTRLAEIKRQSQEQESFLKSRHERLVEPDKMADLLQQVLRKNDKLKLVKLQTLPVSQQSDKTTGQQKQIFTHGIQITVRGSYMDMMHYLAELEALPVQMFWGEISMSVEKYPDAVLTLTLYTLSLDKSWLTV